MYLFKDNTWIQLTKVAKSSHLEEHIAKALSHASVTVSDQSHRLHWATVLKVLSQGQLRNVWVRTREGQTSLTAIIYEVKGVVSTYSWSLIHLTQLVFFKRLCFSIWK